MSDCSSSDSYRALAFSAVIVLVGRRRYRELHLLCSLELSHHCQSVDDLMFECVAVEDMVAEKWLYLSGFVEATLVAPMVEYQRCFRSNSCFDVMDIVQKLLTVQ